jgi:hypothetical protein
MKKFAFFIILALFLTGCSSIRQSGYLEHHTMYKNWDHMKFSWFGYNNPTAEDAQKAQEQGWWGIDVPIVPGE